MKKYLKNKLVFLSFCMLPLLSSSQIICHYVKVPTFPAGYSQNLKSVSTISTVNDFKTIRVNINFVLRADGTGNFSETKDINGNTSANNGYWFAEKCIELCNSQLVNETMTQELSYRTIPVYPINYGYKLFGVYFVRNDNHFNYPDSWSGLNHNSSEVISIYVYPNNDGEGAGYTSDCWVGGAQAAYNGYLSNGMSGFQSSLLTRDINHEIGHCLSLDHCKRYSWGRKCLCDSLVCLDGCNDTPTSTELINDGYTDPFVWFGSGYSNNIMDYSYNQKAFTPCQIEQVHNHIESSKTSYLYGNFLSQSTQITSFTNNEGYIGYSVTITPSSTISIPNGKRLFIDSKQLTINSSFEVPLGSDFQFIPNGM
jgi:hypothetical protein